MIRENQVVVDLQGRVIEQGSLNLSSDSLECSAIILTEMLLKFIQNGGDSKNLKENTKTILMGKDDLAEGENNEKESSNLC